MSREFLSSSYDKQKDRRELDHAGLVCRTGIPACQFLYERCAPGRDEDRKDGGTQKQAALTRKPNGGGNSRDQHEKNKIDRQEVNKGS